MQPGEPTACIVDAFCTCTEFHDNCLQHTNKDNVCPRSLAVPGTRGTLQKPLSADPTAHHRRTLPSGRSHSSDRERTAPSGAPGPAPPPSRSGTTAPSSTSPPPAQSGLRSPRLSLRPDPLAPARLCPGTLRRRKEESRGRLTQCWAAWRHGYSAARTAAGSARDALPALRAAAARGAGRSRGRAGRAGARGGSAAGGGCEHDRSCSGHSSELRQKLMQRSARSRAGGPMKASRAELRRLRRAPSPHAKHFYPSTENSNNFPRDLAAEGTNERKDAMNNRTNLLPRYAIFRTIALPVTALGAPPHGR